MRIASALSLLASGAFLIGGTAAQPAAAARLAIDSGVTGFGGDPASGSLRAWETGQFQQ